MRFIYRPNHPMADQNGLVDANMAYPIHEGIGLHVISDIMPPTRHPVTGQLMDSKSEFRKVTKVNGCIEVGDDRSLSPDNPRKRIELDRNQRASDIARAINELKHGR